VSAIASQSLRGAMSIEHAAEAIEGRLLALGRAHDLLMQVSWGSASLTETILNAVKPYDTEGGRFLIEGTDVQITSGAVIALAMTFNELCTNTTKFGALSVVGGVVQISWTIAENTSLKLTWAENAGPAVRVPTRRSFGTRMMESLGKQLKAEVNLAYEPDGFVYTLDVPLASLTMNP
jgi:two-component sensor histidine kinase